MGYILQNCSVLTKSSTTTFFQKIFQNYVLNIETAGNIRSSIFSDMTACSSVEVHIDKPLRRHMALSPREWYSSHFSPQRPEIQLCKNSLHSNTSIDNYTTEKRYTKFRLVVRVGYICISLSYGIKQSSLCSGSNYKTDYFPL
jgi:hypothetical protein